MPGVFEGWQTMIDNDYRPDVPRGPTGQDLAMWRHILFGWEHLADVPQATTSARLPSWAQQKHLLHVLGSIQKQD